ncbi:uncharacterized protein RSE6_04764 [Rhynchosporium secalis]|uniref:Amidase domain-containing protein n=1 Tax=Rhynchosporium secalis TaxID=38038 RepID=A0A1E1M643_RHYSE|nr:uncharacterized protein RSE6_04764 [Rhynchosporium secalis]
MAATVTTGSRAAWQEVAADGRRHWDTTIAAIESPSPEINAILPNPNTIPLAKKYLTVEEIATTESCAEDLVVQLSDGKLSSTTAMKGFLCRAALARKAVHTFFHTYTATS